MSTVQSHTAMQLVEPGAELEAVAVPTESPGPGQVRVTVHASGVCGADIALVAARASAYGFPVTPGHEIAGVIAELGVGVEGHAVGDRVAVGWFGGSCGHCTACRTADPVHCPQRRMPGISYPGGWAGSITVPASALAAIPDGLTMTEAAPFGCAGVTAFNAVRTGHPQPGDLVAVLGIGGVGHMALQFAARMGYETVAIARGDSKEADARALGAHHYIDSAREQPGQALRALGGAALAISTAASTGPIPELVDGLANRGHLTVVGLGDDMSVGLRVDRLVMGARTVGGQLTGNTADTEQAMKFAVATGIRPRVETVALTSAQEALRALGEGRPRYRTVLTPDPH